MVDSPCNGICEVVPATGFCLGCLRTLDEIAGWGGMGDEAKLEVLARVAERRRPCGPTRTP